jgi:asparagine synthase (glutamine-hydrolysing)
MCGIFGSYQFNANFDRSISRSRLLAAQSALSKRGPDDSGLEDYLIDFGNKKTNGFLSLGQNRLSIIDLSSAGHQPMHSECGRYTIVFNGEIYNYRELRLELLNAGCVFRSDSDTEVLLAAWRCWGVSCLMRFIGMFAFVVFDRQAHTLTFARDAFGIKPLFMSLVSEGLVFASELPALLKLRGGDVKLNHQQAYDYLVHGDYDTQSNSFVEDVNQLEPGYCVTYDMAAGLLQTPIRWWAPSLEQTSQLSFCQASEELRERFLHNIRYHLRSDVPLGTALSGGVDSSAVVCAIRCVEPDAPIHTFSFLDKGSPVSEERWIDMVNAHVSATPHSVHVSSEELVRDLDDMIIAQGEPFLSTSIYAQYRVFKLAKSKGVTVTLDGQGADELLAGYRGFPGKRIRSLLEMGHIKEAANFLHNWSQWPDRALSIGIKAAVAEFVDGSVYQALRAANDGKAKHSWLNISVLMNEGVTIGYPRLQLVDAPKGRRLIAALAQASSRNGLPAYLRHADRNSMRFSVESRVPFLTTDLAQFLFSLPEEYLISQQGETKSVFKAAMRGIVPDAILDRRDKIGFATPEQDWLVQIAPQAKKWLEESEPLAWLNKQEMINEFDAIIAGHVPFSWQAWRFINFCRWYSLVFVPHLRA